LEKDRTNFTLDAKLSAGIPISVTGVHGDDIERLKQILTLGVVKTHKNGRYEQIAHSIVAIIDLSHHYLPGSLRCCDKIHKDKLESCLINGMLRTNLKFKSMSILNG